MGELGWQDFESKDEIASGSFVEDEPEEKEYDEDDFEDLSSNDIIYDSTTTLYGATLNRLPIEEMKAVEKISEYPKEAPNGEYIESENVEIEVKRSETDLQAEKERTTMLINGLKKDVEDFTRLIVDGAKEYKDTSSLATKQREYTKDASKVMPRIVHAKAYEKGGFLKKLMFFAVACVAAGIFFGVMANSYYNYMSGEVTSAMSCSFSWVTVEDMPVDMSPFHSDIFMTGLGVGAGVLGIIGIFIYLDSDAKKQSRVGHEHGSARVANNSDHKIYSNRFMER